jgi:hypothetical protein
LTSLSLRGLVENPYELELRPTRGTGQPHPLGMGIAPTKRWLPHPDGVLPLPSRGPVIAHLLQARKECLPPDLAEFSDSAWAGLLATPGLAVPLKLAAQLKSHDPLLQMRTFGLVTVYKRPDEDLTRAGLTRGRVAATSRLTLGIDGRSGHVEAATLSSEWHMSSSGLLAELTQLRDQAFPTNIPTRTRRRITVLIHPEVTERLTDADRIRLNGMATLLESALDLVDRARMDKLSVTRRLAGNAGGALVTIGPMDTSTRHARDEYLSVDPQRLFRHVPGSTSRDLFEAVLEQIMELSGVSSSLLPLVPADMSPARKEVRPPIPIAKPIACLHHGNRFYLLDGETGLWWTRDDDRHAGTIFKTYKELDAQLVHQADRDAHGAVIDKHKGPSGRRIPRAELRGCSKMPHKHLS